MTAQTIDPTTRRVPRWGGFNGTLLAIELKRMLRNRRTVFFTLLMPALLYLLSGRATTTGTRPGPRQRLGVHPDLHGRVRRGAGLDGRWRDGRHRARPRVVAPAPADPALAGRLHPRQVHRGAGSRSPVRGRRQRRRRHQRQGDDADPRLDRSGGHRLGGVDRLRCPRSVHGLPAAERERHADARSRPGPARRSWVGSGSSRSTRTRRWGTSPSSRPSTAWPSSRAGRWRADPSTSPGWSTSSPGSRSSSAVPPGG